MARNVLEDQARLSALDICVGGQPCRNEVAYFLRPMCRDVQNEVKRACDKIDIEDARFRRERSSNLSQLHTPCWTNPYRDQGLHLKPKF